MVSTRRHAFSLALCARACERASERACVRACVCVTLSLSHSQSLSLHRWLAQESADTSVGQDGQVLTNKEDFDVQTLKQDLIRLDRTTAALQQQMTRVRHTQILTSNSDKC